jgi:hypothetical protein
MKFLTFLNSGCLDICLNMLKSAENVGINMEDFIIACMDEDVYESLSDKGYVGAYLYIDQKLKGYQEWSFDESSGFRNIVRHKWKIIDEVHRKHPNLMWVDTDIVFRQNPVEILTGHKEVLFQGDSPGSTLCTGFMVFNETQECRKLIEECGSDETDDDQLIMNRVALEKYRDNIALLSEDLFPNGNVYYQQGKKENAMIVHNNWMVGVQTKIQKFKEENLWFL